MEDTTTTTTTSNSSFMINVTNAPTNKEMSIEIGTNDDGNNDDDDDTSNNNNNNHSQKTKKIFVMIPKQINNPFFDFSEAGCLFQAKVLSQELKDDGDGGTDFVCEYIGPEHPDPYDQAALVKQVMERSSSRIHGIAISVIDANIVTPILISARNKGIPVVTFDSDSHPAGRSSYIGTDNYAMGQTLAKILQQLKPEGGIYGLLSDSAPNLLEREQGFRDYIEKFGRWKESSLSPLQTDDLTSTSLDRMDDFAALQPNNLDDPTNGIHAIVPVGGWPMYDPIRYSEFRDTHRNLSLVVGDTLPVQIDLLMSGYADSLVGQVPRDMGVEAVNALYALSANQPVNTTITLTYLVEMVRLPLVLPPLEVSENHLMGLRWIGITLFSLISLTSISCIVWTLWKRKIRIVRASQPIFLIVIAMGAWITGSTILPLSMDDSHPEMLNGRGDKICVAVPWLAGIGFAVTFSALFSKTLRINRVFQKKRNTFARVTVRATDVMIPFLVVVGANTLILLIWTIENPPRYVRMAHEGTDVWNRLISYFGECKSEESSVPYLVPLAVINFGLLLVANWQAYQAQSIESEFAESKYIGIVMISLLQAGLTGIPILFVVRETPEAYYLILIFIISMATLLLIFVPKMIFERNYQKRTPAERNALFLNAIRESSRNSINSRGTNAKSKNASRMNAINFFSNQSGIGTFTESPGIGVGRRRGTEVVENDGYMNRDPNTGIHYLPIEPHVQTRITSSHKSKNTNISPESAPDSQKEEGYQVEGIDAANENDMNNTLKLFDMNAEQIIDASAEMRV